VPTSSGVLTIEFTDGRLSVFTLADCPTIEVIARWMGGEGVITFVAAEGEFAIRAADIDNVKVVRDAAE
jgi:hypothetical protein